MSSSTNQAAALPTLRLKRGEDRRLQAGHLWVFSNEVDVARTPLTSFEPGALCQVISDRDKVLGLAYVNPRSLICARILSQVATEVPDAAFLVRRLRAALALRERLYAKPYYRWVYGESDLLPGLVLDRFGADIVGQIGTAGMERLRGDLETAIDTVLAPRSLLWKNDSGARELEGLPSYVEPGRGKPPSELRVEESGVVFELPVGHLQKTGWFYDQAVNRTAFHKYVRGARVLDVFSYAGAWALGASRAGASSVTCVDSSASALGTVARTAAGMGAAVECITGDAFDVLESLHAAARRFDVIVVDPPAFIKRKKDQPKGEAAYRRINQLAMQLLAPDGILVACSCSHHLSADALLLALQRAGRHLGRFVQVIETGGQGPDHPVHPAILETRYLKSFTCRVTAEVY